MSRSNSNVGNLPFEATGEDLREIFGMLWSGLDDAIIVTRPEAGSSRALRIRHDDGRP